MHIRLCKTGPAAGCATPRRACCRAERRVHLRAARKDLLVRTQPRLYSFQFDASIVRTKKFQEVQCIACSVLLRKGNVKRFQPLKFDPARLLLAGEQMEELARSDTVRARRGATASSILPLLSTLALVLGVGLHIDVKAACAFLEARHQIALVDARSLT